MLNLCTLCKLELISRKLDFKTNASLVPLFFQVILGLFTFLFVHLSHLSHISLSGEHDRLHTIICFGNLAAEKSITLLSKQFTKLHTHLDKLSTFFVPGRKKNYIQFAIQDEKYQRNVFDVIPKQFSPLLFHKLLTICVTPEHLLILSTSKQHILIGLPLIKIFF